MTAFDPDAAAALLLQARRPRGGKRVPLLPLPEGVHPQTLVQGVMVQRALAGLQHATRPAGFKIGATAQRMQRYLGLSGPAAGFMAASGLLGDGSTLDVDSFFRPGVECELAVHLARDLPAGACTPGIAREAVGEVMAAIEIVENRYADLQVFGAAAMVADQVFHAAAVLGPPHDSWRELDFAGLRGDISVDGTVRDGGFGRDLVGGPFHALAWLAGSAEAAAFGGLRAGQVVMLGSVCPPVWLDRPAQIEVAFPPLPTVRLSLVKLAP
ncbi:MAG: fumarylacetoacetate hydrolase family protein [Acetobacteraceae bacterium]|nr:fumarylacetoacetate hydrolase family protein [Acetobacteraceae bacterium]